MNDEFRTVVLVNPLSKPFNLEYNKTIARTIPPGKSLRMPWIPLGFLGLKHLIDFCCNENNESTGDPAIRAKWEAIVLIRDDDNMADTPLTPDQVLQRKLDLLNNTNASNMVQTCEKCQTKTFNLKEHNALNHPVVPDQTASTPPPPLTEEQKKLQEQQANLQQVNDQALQAAVANKEPVELPEEKVDVTPAVVPNVPKAEPTREELIKYAGDVLKMTLTDAKTMEFLNTADIEVIKKELNYGL